MMTRSKKKPKPPESAGSRLREAIESEFDLSEPEALLLANACATADMLERVEREIATGPLIVAGSRQQQVSNPLIATQIELGAHLVRLLGALRVPLGEEDPEKALTSRMARKAAMVRWHGWAG
jgi:hypothetical protein